MSESNQIIGLAAAGQGLAKALSAEQYAAARESAQTIVKGQLQVHERAAAAWRWLDAAMEIHKPTTEEESALWDLLSRARRERY